MRNRINMVRRVKVLNATSVPNVSKPSRYTFDMLYYRRQVSEEDVRIVLQSHTEGSSLRGISRISGLAYDTVVSIVQAAALKASNSHYEI